MYHGRFSVSSATELGNIINKTITFEKTEMPDLSYHEAVHKAFLDIARANPRRCLVLDASAAPAALADIAIAAINERLGGDR